MAVAMGGCCFLFVFKQENILMRSTAFTWSPLSLSAVDKGDIHRQGLHMRQPVSLLRKLLSHQSLSESLLYPTCHMAVTAQPSRTFFHPTRSARHSESCWVPPCGEADIRLQGVLKNYYY